LKAGLLRSNVRAWKRLKTSSNLIWIINRKNYRKVSIVSFDCYMLTELQGLVDQNQLLKASRDPPSKATYEAVKEWMTTVSKVNGIDKLFREQNLNILAFPMDSLIVFMSAASGIIHLAFHVLLSIFDRCTGYPIATMPLGVIQADGRPYGLGIMAQTGNEHLMFQFMSAFEAHFPPRVVPSRVGDNGLDEQP
jgi:hypothetical protein